MTTPDRAEMRAEAAKLRNRLRETAQILIEWIGAEGPANAEDLAKRAGAEVEQLRTEIAKLRAYVGDEMLRSDYRTAAGMRAEIERLRGRSCESVIGKVPVERVVKYTCPECKQLCDGSRAHKTADRKDCYWVLTRRGGWRQLGDYDG